MVTISDGYAHEPSRQYSYVDNLALVVGVDFVSSHNHFGIKAVFTSNGGNPVQFNFQSFKGFDGGAGNGNQFAKAFLHQFDLIVALGGAAVIFHQRCIGNFFIGSGDCFTADAHAGKIVCDAAGFIDEGGHGELSGERTCGRIQWIIHYRIAISVAGTVASNCLTFEIIGRTVIAGIQRSQDHHHQVSWNVNVGGVQCNNDIVGTTGEVQFTIENEFHL